MALNARYLKVTHLQEMSMGETSKIAGENDAASTELPWT
jgi:hypothetical protein